MDMKDALIEVKEFSNDDDKLNESLLGLLRTTAITINVANINACIVNLLTIVFH